MIRDFTAEDLPLYMEMSQEFYHSDAVLHPVDEENFLRTFLLIQSGSPYVRGFMLELESMPAGYAMISITYSNEAGGLVILIEELYVRDAFRSRGLGSEFFGFLEQEYRGTAARFRLEVTENNLKAQKLYENLGFHFIRYLQMVKNHKRKNF